MKKRINFYETVMKCSAEQVEWRELDRITDKADDFPKYYGNYFNDEESNVYALFGLKADRYCVLIDNLELYTEGK